MSNFNKGEKHNRYKHGMYKAPEHVTWANIKSRCYSKNSKHYNRYGGRGIRVCDRWLNSFENFYADMGKKPTGLSIDRIDNNGDYSKENCRWADNQQQSNNRRSNTILELNGKIHTLAEWSRIINVKPSTICQRLYVCKWPLEKVLA